MSWRTIKKKDLSGGVTLRLQYSSEWNEWRVGWSVGGKFCEEKTYYTSDREDAEYTFMNTVCYWNVRSV